ncbi:MAG: hypothetical protein DRI90_18420 [Deltaproteobacteria bacterium]|nr:MAG: hypothetical protein DRI90_18420 [Deltaproteobacteria bacterium]
MEFMESEDDKEGEDDAGRKEPPSARQSFPFSWRSPDWWPFLLAMLAVPFHRLYFIFWIHPPTHFVFSDMEGYADRAWRLADPYAQLSIVDMMYPPGTHVLMAPLMWLVEDKEVGLELNQWLWWVLAVGTLWLVGLLALKLFKHPWAAACAVVLLMLHSGFTAFTGFFMSESPFSFFMALCLLVGLHARDMDVQRPWRRALVYAIAGTTAGLAACIRPQFVFTAMVIGFPLLSLRRPWIRICEATALAVTFAIPCVLAMELNRHAADRFVGMSRNAGLNFYQGHCDVVIIHAVNDGLRAVYGAPVRIQRMQRTGGDPDKMTVFHGHHVYDSEFFFDLGETCIEEDGWGHLFRIYTNVADLFATTDPWPPRGELGKVVAWHNEGYCWSLLLILPTAFWLGRRRWPEKWLLVQYLTVMPVALVFYGDPRYRIPYDMFGILMLTGILSWANGWRSDCSSSAPEEEGEDGDGTGEEARSSQEQTTD